MTGPEKKFLWTWLACKGPPLAQEYRFDLSRRYRFDFAHPVAKVAFEIEGGIWKRGFFGSGPGGRHNRGAGFQADCEKYLLAALQDWRVVRLTPAMITVPTIRQLVAWTTRL